MSAAKLALALVVAIALPTADARAEGGGNVELQSFRPALDSKGLVTLDRSQVLGHLEPSFGLVTNWAAGLLELEGNGSSYRVEHLLSPTVVAALGVRLLGQDLQLALAIPFRVVSGDRGPDDDLGTPDDPNDDRNVIVEIRAGTGGDEAALFAGELVRMYTRYAEDRSWKVELVSHSEGGAGGVKEAVFVVRGPHVYGDLRYESGVHRVQRIPTTESQGRIHTSAGTVAVLLPGAKAPKLVRREDLKLMKRGAVIVDVAVDQGGCVETIRPTTHEDPIYEVDGVVHYGVANMPGGVPRTSTLALTNATLPYAATLARLGWRDAGRQDAALRHGLNVVQGEVVYPGVAEAFGLPLRDVETVLG